MGIDRERVRENVLAASTADLLERVAVFRSEMEPEAIRLIEDELEARGIGKDEVATHRAARMPSLLVGPDGHVLRCAECCGPATVRRTGWHRMFGLVPIFPVLRAFCTQHGG